jgi:hypothetical protein
MTEWEEGYFTAIADCATNTETWARLFNERRLENGIREAILFRRFSPVSTYEPDPKREEWRGMEDCRCCPAEVLTRRKHLICSSTNNTATCRFSEYRRILFRRF